MIKQSMDEVYKFNLPDPDDVSVEWFEKMYSSKGKYFATILKKANSIDHLSKNNNKAVKEYFEKNRTAVTIYVNRCYNDSYVKFKND